MPVLTLIITDVGRAAIVNAENTGTLPVVINQVALGSGQWSPDATATALLTEIKRVNTIGGIAINPDTIHVTVTDDSADVYSLGEFGLYTDTGVLFAIYSDAVNGITDKVADIALLMANDVVFTSIAPGAITIGGTGFLNPTASETQAGVLPIATQLLVDLGVDHTSAITPKTLASILSMYLLSAGYNAADVLAKLLTVHGASSGLDSDFLDGQHGSFYQNAGNLNAGTLPALRFTDTSHGNRGGVSLHALANSVDAGFMSPFDFNKLTGVEPAAKDDQTAAEILALLLTVDGELSDLDAAKLGGLNPSFYAKSDHKFNDDLNTIIDSGMYRIESANLNMPVGVSFGQLLVIRGSGDTILQIAAGFLGNEIHWRSGNPADVGGSGAWSVWREFWHDGNDGAGSDLDAGKLAGALPSETQSASTIVKRNAAGEIMASLFHSIANFTTLLATALWVETNGDGYMRRQTAAQFIANFDLATNASVTNKPEILDTPIFVAGSAIPSVATAVGHALLDSESAKAAILKVFLRSNTSASPPSVINAHVYFASTTFAQSNEYRKATAIATQSTGDDMIGDCVTDQEFTVNLDTNNDFWWSGTVGVFGSGNATADVYLVGYYK